MRIKTNIKYLKYLSAFIILMLFAVTCDDHGIEPKPETPIDKVSGFSGSVTFIGEWPDSIKRAFVVVFQNPLLTPGDFTVFNLKYLSREIPIGAAAYEYSSLDSAFIPSVPGPFPPGTYAYIAVAQQSTDELSLARKDWFVSGIYYTQGDTTQPGTMLIPDSTFVENINITVDFNNPPPQPPGYN
ncbi:MAG: hypothetical protein IH618_16130 [Ignavibacteriaceae bacterium]|nr:hypothetical protein [Ignavibacteriaceae bacterium]